MGEHGAREARNIIAETTENSITLSWQAPPDRDFAGVKITGVNPVSPEATVGKGVYGKIYGGLAAGTTYKFSVKTYDSAGSSSEGKTIGAYTAAAGAFPQASGYSIAVPGGTLTFNVNAGGSITVTSAPGATDLVIPSSIGGHPVTQIAGDAFKANHSITSLVIPDSITVCGTWVCWQCQSMTSVAIPDSWTSIPAYFLDCCYILPSVDLPPNLERIEYHAFNMCNTLTEVTLPATVNFLATECFYWCNQLSVVNVLADTPPELESGVFGFNASGRTSTFRPRTWMTIKPTRTGRYMRAVFRQAHGEKEGTDMKNGYIRAAAFALAGFFFLCGFLSCRPPIEPVPPLGEAKLEVSFASSSSFSKAGSPSRTIVPASDLGIDSITVTVRQGATVLGTATVNTASDTCIISDITPGTVTVTAKAYAGGTLAAEGEAEGPLVLTADEVKAVRIALLPAADAGTGTIRLSLRWPVSAGAGYVECALDGGAAESQAVTEVVEDLTNGCTFEKLNVGAGAHTLYITFYDNGTDRHMLGAFVEAVNVYANCTSDHWLDGEGGIFPSGCSARRS